MENYSYNPFPRLFSNLDTCITFEFLHPFLENSPWNWLDAVYILFLLSKNWLLVLILLSCSVLTITVQVYSPRPRGQTSSDILYSEPSPRSSSPFHVNWFVSSPSPSPTLQNSNHQPVFMENVLKSLNHSRYVLCLFYAVQDFWIRKVDQFKVWLLKGALDFVVTIIKLVPTTQLP